MGSAIGQMLGSAVGVAISPLPLIVVILMLSTPRGRANGIAFALGWVVTLAVLGAVLVLGRRRCAVRGRTGDADLPAVKPVPGVLFALMAVKQWLSNARRT